MTFPPKVWDGVLTRLQKELPAVSFQTWILRVAAVPGDGGVELLCPNAFHRDRVRDYFLPMISRCLREELGRDVPVRAVIRGGADSSSDPKPEDLAAEADAADPAGPHAPESPVSGSIPIAATPIPPSLPAEDAGRSVGARPLASTSADPRSAPVFRLNASRGSRAGGARRFGSPKANGRTNETTSLNQALDGVVRPIAANAARSEPSERRTDPSPRLQAGGKGDQGGGAQPPVRKPPTVQGAPQGGQGPSRRGVSTPSRQRTFPLTFDSFAVGPCNALAREAAFAIANQRQAGLNLLYLVSQPGLGKTHLSRSVIEQTRSSIGNRARYTTAESFTNEFTQAIQNHQMPRFKRRFRNDCDLLIVEDIQFLARKENTQLEFFHTVQHVLDCGGRVLLTGESFPNELTDLDPRVGERISSGMIAEIDFPDAAVRRNILRSKAAHGGIRLPEDCLELLVQDVRGNVRELEGALIQLVTTSSLLKKPIDLELTNEAMQRRVRKRSVAKSHPTPEEIIKVVATFFQTSPDTIASKSRRRDVLLPRQLAMYLCRRYTDASLAEIGRAMDRNHPSVANAIRAIERRVLEQVRLRYQVESLIDRLDELGYSPIHGGR